MYQKIRQQEPCVLKYARKLISENVVNEEEYQVIMIAFVECKVEVFFLFKLLNSFYNCHVFVIQSETLKYGVILEETFENAKLRPQMKIADWLDSKWGGK